MRCLARPFASYYVLASNLEDLSCRRMLAPLLRLQIVTGRHSVPSDCAIRQAQEHLKGVSPFE